MPTFLLDELHGGTFHDGSTVEATSPENLLSIAKAVMILASADGEFSTAESEYFFAMMAGFGLPEGALALLREFDPTGEDATEFLRPEYRSMARHFIYDAIKVCRVDGYHERERAAILRAAASLGVGEPTVVAIEGLIEVESSLRTARLSLLRQPAQD
jgi:tellurite resistance protein